MTEAKSRLDDLLQAAEAVPEPALGTEASGEAAKKGLASFAGGWEGSDELADLVEEIRRTAHRP